MSEAPALGSVRARVTALLALAAVPLLIVASALAYEDYRQQLARPLVAVSNSVDSVAARLDAGMYRADHSNVRVGLESSGEASVSGPFAGNLRFWVVAPSGSIRSLDGASDADLPPQDRIAGLLRNLSTAERGRSAADQPFDYAARRLQDGQVLLAGYNAAPAKAAARADLLRHGAVIALTCLIGMVIANAGTSGAVVRPLRALTGAVERWRTHGVFDPGPLEGMPNEIANLSLAFSHATNALAEHEDELRDAAARQDLLMQEIHHRVKNNLQVVASLLNLQASRIRVPAARAEFRSAGDRVRALATLHRHLYATGELHTINMRGFLLELCGQLFQAMGEREGERIRLVVEASELRMTSDQAVPLSLIVTEAVSNAIRYAFPEGRRGRVAVRLSSEGERARLTIEDDGVGIRAGADGSGSEQGARQGLGTQLIRGFVRQLGAELQVQEHRGTRYDIIIPLGGAVVQGGAAQDGASQDQAAAPQPAAAG